MILGIDQGTTGTTAILLNTSCQLKASVTVAVPQHFPRPGWVEHDPEQIWKTVEKAVRLVLKKARLSAHKIQTIGITNQRETVSIFRDQKALHRFIVWQDRRTAADCDKIRAREIEIMEKAGTPVDPYFSASKIAWILREKKIKDFSGLRFRTIDSYLLYRMTGEDAIEVSNASRTSLMSLKNLKWDEELFSIYGIPRSLAPQIVASQNSQLKTRDLGFLPAGIPVSGILGDQQAALFGQLCWAKGEGKITFGTGSFLLLNTGSDFLVSQKRLVSTVALQDSKGEVSYALEGSAFICGAWVEWLRDQLKLLKTSNDVEKLALKVKNSEGVLVIPALTGLGAPFWNAQARGAILGLTRGSSIPQIARASLEALAFQNRALVDAMRTEAELEKLEWKVDGGAVANNLLMQIQADVLKSNIIRPKNLEATATGVALLAGLEQRLFDEKQIRKSWKLDKKFRASDKESEALDKTYSLWKERLSHY